MPTKKSKLTETAAPIGYEAQLWWRAIDAALAAAGMPPAGFPIALEEKVRQWEAEQARARQEAEERARHKGEASRRPRDSRARPARLPLEPPAPPVPKEEPPAPWGTPEARRQAIERLKRKIAERERRKKGEG
jgi:hypothetical protein